MKRRVKLPAGWAEADARRNIEIGDRLLPASIDVVFPGVDGQPGLTMTIDSTSGVPRCRALSITSVEGGREVRTTDLRAVTVDDWIEAIVPLFADEITERTATGIASVIRAPDSSSDDYRAARATLRDARLRSRRTVGPELLQKVADVYRSNQERPAEAVRLAFSTSERTAFRWISLAREEGLLEPKGKI